MPNLVYAKVEIDAGNFSPAAAALDRAGAILRTREHAPDEQNYLILLRQSQLSLRQGKREEATRLGLQALAAQSRILGPDDPSAVIVASHVERLYQSTNDAVTAEKYGRRALTLARRIYGESHPTYAKVLSDYAINFGILGEQGVKGANREAEGLFRKVLAIRLRTLGPRNSATAAAYYDIANASAARGRWAAALGLIEHAQKVWESSQGEDSPQVAWAFAMEARALIHLGRSTEAVPLALRSMRISERRQIPAYTGKACEELGKAYFAMGRYSAAAEALHRAAELYGPMVGKSANLQDYYGNLLTLYADALRRAGRSSEADAALARVAAIRAPNKIANVPLAQSK
jgi:tetratricopeptide (TPR) repeat protein